MKFPEHVTLSFLVAQLGVQQEFGFAGTALVVAAGCLPDLDSLTLLAGWRVYRKYHRVIGHGLPMTVLGPVLLALFGSTLLGASAFLFLWFWLQVALLLHLLTDVLFYNWPAQLLWPLSSRAWAASLLTWNDLVPTAVLYLASLFCLLLPSQSLYFAVAGIGTLFLYLGWRMLRPRPLAGWGAWITGAWAAHSSWVWRWLTGDFIT